MGYWLTSASIAALAACFSSSGHGKSGKPWARFTPLCSRHNRVISRMTDSVNDAALLLTKATRRAYGRYSPVLVYSTTALISSAVSRPDQAGMPSRPLETMRISSLAFGNRLATAPPPNLGPIPPSPLDPWQVAQLLM